MPPDSRLVTAVSSGTYSDYHVYAIFESKDEAEAYVQAYEDKSYGSYFVEEFTYYPKGTAPSVIPVHFLYWNPEKQWEYSSQQDDTPELRRKYARPEVREVGSSGGVWLIVTALDKQDAQKSLGDAVAVIRNREGL